ncbi:hypothetical protein DEX24_08665 [Kurthia sibirica]|uniref:Uncharacterized protein n=1 Tax=Kurthia sibirica TaxID=202750 RepID=A0A2U3ALM1_9BACL|nr:hypothetical protein DEX24_08665 [Kurthia sibirica]
MSGVPKLIEQAPLYMAPYKALLNDKKIARTPAEKQVGSNPLFSSTVKIKRAILVGGKPSLFLTI